ncbi:MAG: sigma-70 family RNA polymerase sigma factor [Solirubrobacterales bacterium]|nr:sigma-70 family RNA polymerase sigma factor [Solirubrobacterales bacterium]
MHPAEFEAERPRLMSIAARIVGSSVDAEDVLQEAWLRLSVTEEVEDLPAWLTTVTTRLCLDHLRRRRTRATVETDVAAEVASIEPARDPETDALVAERVGDALQVVLDALAPGERVAFVLHDVFGFRFEEISSVLGRSSVAVRQMASRARRKVQGLPETTVEREARAQSDHIVQAFLKAAHGGDLPALLTLLAPNAIMRSDPTGQSLGAIPVYEGAAAVATRFDGAQGASAVTIDGRSAGAWIVRGLIKVAFVFRVEAGLIQEIELIADPEVIAILDVASLPKR